MPLARHLQPPSQIHGNALKISPIMRNFARKIIGLFLMLALVVMPVRIAFADNHPANMGSAQHVSGASQPPGAAASSPQAHHNHLAMPHPISSDMSSTMASDTDCDTPAADTACDKSHATNTTHHCSSDAHCCVALIASFYDATHVAPYTPRSILSITLTSIIIPTATKPPRHHFPA